MRVLAVTCHLQFRQNDRDLLRDTAVTRGWNGYRNKAQRKKLNWREAQNLKGLKAVLNWANICFAEHSSEYSSNFTSFLN